VKKVLFVCTGNTCRSVLAHRYAALLGAAQKLPFEFTSAGLLAGKNIEQPQIVADLLKKEGVKDFKHVPVELTADIAAQADLILAMTADHKARIAQLYPAAAAKTYTLIDYAGFGADDIADPYRRDDLFYFEVFKLIKSAVRAALERLKKEVK
jgi:protein-tyrosine phosphatase